MEFSHNFLKACLDLQHCTHFESMLYFRWHDHKLRAGHSPIDFLDENSRTNGVGNGTKRGSFVRTSSSWGRFLFGKCRCQPFSNFLWHGFRLQFGQIVSNSFVPIITITGNRFISSMLLQCSKSKQAKVRDILGTVQIRATVGSKGDKHGA